MKYHTFDPPVIGGETLDLGIALRHLKQHMKKALGVEKPTELSKSLRNLYRIAPHLNSLVSEHSEVAIGKYETALLFKSVKPAIS